MLPILGFFRETEPIRCERERECVCVYVKVYFNELVQVIVEAWQVQTLRRLAGLIVKLFFSSPKAFMLEIWRPVLLFESKSPLLQRTLLLKGQLFVLFRPSADYIRPTHIMRGILLHSKFSDLNVNLIQKYCNWDIQNNIWPNIWTLWPNQFDT